MDELVVSTEVFVEPETAFEFLVDFPGYVRYSDYLEAVRQRGDGGAGTTYELELAWWRLTYTARTEVTDVEAPERIGWRVLGGLDAEGEWRVGETPDGSSVALHIRYRTESADQVGLDLPRFVSLGWVVRRLTPLVREEAERTVERIVADLEGEPRPVELRIEMSDD